MLKFPYVVFKTTTNTSLYKWWELGGKTQKPVSHLIAIPASLSYGSTLISLLEEILGENFRSFFVPFVYAIFCIRIIER